MCARHPPQARSTGSGKPRLWSRVGTASLGAAGQRVGGGTKSCLPTWELAGPSPVESLGTGPAPGGPSLPPASSTTRPPPASPASRATAWLLHRELVHTHPEHPQSHTRPRRRCCQPSPVLPHPCSSRTGFQKLPQGTLVMSAPPFRVSSRDFEGGGLGSHCMMACVFAFYL